MKLLKEMQEHCGMFSNFIFFIVKLETLFWKFECFFDCVNFCLGVRKTLNSELWHACAGPLVSLPQVGGLVYYYPQGHSEQVK
jgi:hypothetical protein